MGVRYGRDSPIDPEVGPFQICRKIGYLENWQNASEINVSIYHSTGNDKGILKMLSAFSLMQKLESYAKSKKLLFLHFSDFLTFQFFAFCAKKMYPFPKPKVP